MVVGHPFDLVKVRMQTSNLQESTFGVLRKTFAKEGVPCLYRGVTAPLTAVTPVFALSFWGYDMGKRTVKAMDRSTALNPGEAYKFTSRSWWRPVD